MGIGIVLCVGVQGRPMSQRGRSGYMEGLFPRSVPIRLKYVQVFGIASVTVVLV